MISKIFSQKKGDASDDNESIRNYILVMADTKPDVKETIAPSTVADQSIISIRKYKLN